MSARMQELLRLLAMVVERVRVAGDRAERAESRSEKLARLLDAMSAENASLREELEQAGEAAAQAQASIRALREQIESGVRLNAVLEARVTEAELRIHRAAEALGFARADDRASSCGDGEDRPSAALH